MSITTREASQTEQTAKDIIEMLTPDLQARYVPSQAHGESDFELFRDAERVGIMEVTLSTDATLRADIESVARTLRKGPVLPRSDLHHQWLVRPRAGAHIGRIERMVSRYLAAIEEEGLTTFSVQGARRSAAVRRIIDDLGVVRGDRAPSAGDTGGVCILYPTTSAVSVVADHVFAAVAAEANKPDNRRKLRETGEHVERHLFVVVDSDNQAPWFALNHQLPPEGLVCSLDAATHFWIAAGTRSPGSWVVWYARRGGCWQRACLSSDRDAPAT